MPGTTWYGGGRRPLVPVSRGGNLLDKRGPQKPSCFLPDRIQRNWIVFPHRPSFPAPLPDVPQAICSP
jgi:hypothetical protein